MIIRILALLALAASAFAQEPVPVKRPAVPSATTLNSPTSQIAAWYRYAVYLEAVIAARPAAPSADVLTRLDAIDAQQKAINANTAALAAGYHQIIKPLADQSATNTKEILANIAALLARPIAPTKIAIAVPNPDDVKAGASVSLIASADGTPPPSWQWLKDGASIPGATNATLQLAAVTSADTGTYTAVATNEAGAAQATINLNVVP